MSDATSWQKEQFSIAFVHAIATRAAYTITSWNVDKDGVDITLRDRGLMVDMQLKCTCSPTVTQSGFSFQLDTKTYDKLRDRERSAPGYLGLIIAPPELGKWVQHRPKEILMACHGYWARIQDRSDPANGETKAIKIPKENRLDGDALRGMFADSRTLLRRGVA